MTATIDLNADLGESFGAYTIGNDKDVLQLISSANITCGFHAGDPRVMFSTCTEAILLGYAWERTQVIKTVQALADVQWLITPKN